MNKLGSGNELLGCRESVSSIVRNLPSAARERWFDHDPPPDESREAMGQALLMWLEKERRHAVAVHLHDATTALHSPDPPPTRTQNPSLTTDKGLFSSSHASTDSHTAGTQPKTSPKPPTPPVPLGSNHTQSGANEETSGSDPPGGRAPILTHQAAVEATAKRKANLEGKGLDKCPLCKQQHLFDKTWATVNPPSKTKMLSTFLLSCPKFKTLTLEQKAATCAAQAAYLVCTGWDHPQHRQSGGSVITEVKCKFKIDGSDCGGAHGRWYHDLGSSVATSNSVTSETQASQPPLKVPASTKCIEPRSAATSYQTKKACL